MIKCHIKPLAVKCLKSASAIRHFGDHSFAAAAPQVWNSLPDSVGDFTSYKERLLRLNLYTLKYRRLRGDMIEVFKLVHNVYDSRVAPTDLKNNYL